MKMSSIKRIAGLVPTSFGYGRGVMSGAMAYLGTRSDVEVLWFQQDYPPSEMLRRWNADGIIGIFSDQAPVDSFLNLEIPIVNVSSGPQPAPVMNVLADQQAFGRLAAEHLQSKGLKHFAYLGVEGYNFSKQREAAFLQNMKGHTIHRLILPPEMWTWLEDLHAWVVSLPRPCGIYCSSDNEARVLLSVCRTGGIRVPDELAVLATGNEADLCLACTPALSSIPGRAEKIGSTAMARLVDKILSPEAAFDTAVIDPTPPVQRASSDVFHVPEDPDINHILRYIREHIQVNLGVDQVAGLYPGSRRTFETRFKTRVGHTPLTEIHRVRIERIKQLLRDTELSLPEIAEQSGVLTINHLCALFKKHTGQSPGDYRLTVRKAR